MLIAQFFEPNPMEVFSEIKEVYNMDLVAMLNNYKE